MVLLLSFPTHGFHMFTFFVLQRGFLYPFSTVYRGRHTHLVFYRMVQMVSRLPVGRTDAIAPSRTHRRYRACSSDVQTLAILGNIDNWLHIPLIKYSHIESRTIMRWVSLAKGLSIPEVTVYQL